MTTNPDSTPPAPRKHRIGSCLCKLIVGALLLFLLVLIAVYTWLHSWKWGDLSDFHESWTPEERAALVAFDDYLRDGSMEADMRQLSGIVMNNLILLESVVSERAASPTLAERISTELGIAFGCYNMGAPMRSELADIAASGSAARPPMQWTWPMSMEDTPARFALFTGNVEAAKALVRHGADPNFYNTRSRESLLTCLLCGSSLAGRSPFPLAERLALADWLVEQGADVHRLRETLRYVPGIAAGDEVSETLRWMFAHGFGTEPYADGAPVYELLYVPHAMEFWKEMFASGRLSVNDVTAQKMPIQVICSNLYRPEQVEMLAWMLQQGATPTISPQQEGLFPTEQPIEMLVNDMRLMEPDNDSLEPVFRAIRLLQRHGAVHPELTLPMTDNAAEFLRLLPDPASRRRPKPVD